MSKQQTCVPPTLPQKCDNFAYWLLWNSFLPRILRTPTLNQWIRNCTTVERNDKMSIMCFYVLEDDLDYNNSSTNTSAFFHYKILRSSSLLLLQGITRENNAIFLISN
ncbi:hypothetical protein RN001_016159 [Aquatica leii]|uniref:Uncharacterized protein n=1 Tax=Aquatica leii TaxID=1421715 RepID=A0AAN7NU41_9COLE|nr:hypothetical protein RN001_016159 [Aquatica leii]